LRRFNDGQGVDDAALRVDTLDLKEAKALVDELVS
jgi:hypothetical protein